MKTIWQEDEPGDNFLWDKWRRIYVEPTGKRFWCYYDGHRSAGKLPDVPLHVTLRWLLEQILLGHVKPFCDEEGDVVSIIVGKGAPRAAASTEKALEQAATQNKGLIHASYMASGRERGHFPEYDAHEKQLWDAVTSDFQRMMEIHYALDLTDLLGRISKKLPKLEMLPILGKAPKATQNCLAEATRCYLLKLDRACIALCRACLEETLKSILTQPMKREWNERIATNKKQTGSPNQMQLLIEVCAHHGILNGHESAAHSVREAGNRVLHQGAGKNTNSDSAGDVLRKTRAIIGVIYRGGAKADTRRKT